MTTFAGFATAAVCLVLTAAVVANYPLAPWVQGIALVLYALAHLGATCAATRADLRVEGLAAVAVVLTLISYLVSGARGLAFPGPEGGSANAYLRPDNALRLAKGFFTALALLPFLRARMRAHSDALVWLGTGMSVGLFLVAAAVPVERALFADICDFTTDHGVVGTFSSMHVGGGYIGACIATALPFLLV